MGKVRTVCAKFALNSRRNTVVLSDEITAILSCTALYLHPLFCHLLYVQYRRISSCIINAIFYCKLEYFTWEKCVQCALTLHSMRVETRLFYPTISLRSCDVQNCTYIPYFAIFYMFHEEEFQAALSTLFSTVSQSILHEKSAYSVRLHCTECALKHGCFIRRYHNDHSMYCTVPTSLIFPSIICSI